MKIHLGRAPEVITDKETEGKYEILVGKTNRVASSANITFKDTEFLLYKTGDKIVMQGNGIYVGSAVGDFINTYLNAGAENVDITNLPTSPIVKQTPDFGEEYDNVILMIGDGMGFNHIKVALANGLDRFIAEELPVKGNAKTHSNNSSVTDSAASATALATGTKTNNGVIGLSPSGKILKNVREIATEIGAQTAVITTDALTGATPGGFLAHVGSRSDTAQIQEQIDKLVAEDSIDYAVGGVGSNLVGYTRTALTAISDTDAPFFIMVEEGGNDSAGHNNDMAAAVTATTRFDEAITYAIEFVLCHPKTVLIITADHETGGIIEDATAKYGYIATTSSHTGANVPVFAIGPSTGFFDGKSVDNTEIFSFMAKAFNAKNAAQEELVPAA